MKVTKDGKLKLARNERQIGNFVFKNEDEHIKISDISSQMTHRISKGVLLGKQLEMAYGQRADEYLHNYAALLFLFSNVVTDEQFFVDINRVCVDTVNRHKEFYGIEEDITAEKDNEILEEAREVYEAIEELKQEE
jgi:hypothetical protein